ncbi:hypothetical protein [Streptomyces sp. NPDC048603]|uniref:hypothetical protein n=1 Tax=Streptomyces sp. NPDC048603 TaxID=3365577 RepID=UPI00371E11A0
MSNMSSIPVLRGHGSTVLRPEQDSLILERPGEKLTIPTRAIAQVHADARSVTIELRALTGTTPSLHHIEDVSETAAITFRDAVNARLSDHAEDADGDALVSRCIVTKTWPERYHRKAGWIMLGYLVGVLALAAATAILSDGSDTTGGALGIVAFGVITGLPLWVGLFATGTLFRAARLHRHGVTVVAVRADAPATYQYTDSSGTTRVVHHRSRNQSIQVAYDPRDLSSVVVPPNPQDWFFDIIIGPGFLLAGLGGIAFVIDVAITEITGQLHP